MTKTEIYECIGKGGRYRKIMTAKPSGTSKDHGEIVVYQCESTGQMYYRTAQDFVERMRLVQIKDCNPPPQPDGPPPRPVFPPTKKANSWR